MNVNTARQTRGFLFADLRDYSHFTERFGDDAAAKLLSRYRALVREAIARFEGAEIRTEGDSFFVVFNTVGSAVQAGMAILEAARSASVESDAVPIRVGVGIHAGETVDGDEGIVSSAVNIAARVCSAAGPGQLLVTETVRGLTRGYLPVRFMPVGARRLKGISEPMLLFRVGEGGDALVRSRAKPSWRRLAGLAAVIAVFVGALMVAGAFGGLLPAARPAASGSGLPSPLVPGGLVASDRGSPHASPAGSGELASYPTEEELALLARVDLDPASCVRADFDELPRVPEYYFDGLRPMAVAASLRCPGQGASEPDEILYFVPAAEEGNDPDARPGGLAEVDAAFLGIAGRQGLAPGDCSDGAEAYGEWNVGPNSGRVLCHVNSRGLAALVWTVEGQPGPVLAQAIAADDDLAGLYRWWRERGRLRIGQ